VTFALENVMLGPATTLVQTVLPHLPPASFGFCYDSAHDQIDGPWLHAAQKDPRAFLQHAYERACWVKELFGR
jgi:hypothetical protein